MKKLFYTLCFLFLITSLSKAQIYKGGWDLGFGINSVRFMGDVNAEALNFGANIFVQKNISERESFRLKFDINRFTAHQVTTTNNSYSLSLEYILKIFPCYEIAPYIGAGMGVYIFQLDNPISPIAKNNTGELSANILFGAYIDWLKKTFGENWKLKVELSQHTMSTDRFDGLYGTNGGFFGGTLDTYIELNLGLIYSFDKGEKTNYCDLPTGVTPNVDLSNIENKLNKIQNELEELKNRPSQAPIVKTDLTEIENMIKKIKPETTTIISGGFSLKNIYFDVNKSIVNFDSYEDLVENLQILQNNSSLKAEIIGHTDDMGNNDANNKLSIERAEFVKKFLVSQGVDASRLTTKGFGASKSLGDNKTSDGRKLNRRVEFKIVK